MPSLSEVSPRTRAETISRPAAMPSSTKTFLPEIFQPSPLLVARVATWFGRWCGPSSTARVATSSPVAILVSQASFCASVPPMTMALAAARPVDRIGEAVRVRPVSSRIRPRPR